MDCQRHHPGLNQSRSKIPFLANAPVSIISHSPTSLMSMRLVTARNEFRVSKLERWMKRFVRRLESETIPWHLDWTFDQNLSTSVLMQFVKRLWPLSAVFPWCQNLSLESPTPLFLLPVSPSLPAWQPIYRSADWSFTISHNSPFCTFAPAGICAQNQQSSFHFIFYIVFCLPSYTENCLNVGSLSILIYYSSITSHTELKYEGQILISCLLQDVMLHSDNLFINVY